MDQERKWEEAAAAPESVQEPVPVPDAEEPAAEAAPESVQEPVPAPDAEEPAVEAAPESVQEPASESAGHSPDGSLNREEESFSPPGDAWEESRAVQQEPQAGDGEPSDSAAFPQTAAQEDEWGTPPPAPVQDREPFSAAGQGDGAPHAQAWQTPGTYPQGNPYAQPYGSYRQPGTYPPGYPPQGTGTYPPPYPPQGAGAYPPPPYPPQGAYGRPYPGAGSCPPPAQPGSYGAPCAGQPHPWQQPGFGAVPPSASYGQFNAAVPPKPPRGKSRPGVRVFLVLLGVLVLASLVGIGATIVDRSLAGMNTNDFPADSFDGWEQTPYFPTIPSDPDGDGGDGGDSGVQEEPIVPGDLPDLIYAQEGITIQPKPEGDPLSAVELYDRSVDSVVGVTAQYDGETSLGSGIVLTQDGYIVTNAHVVLNTSESIVTVKLHDGTEYPAIVIGYEEDSDLAVLRVEAQGLQPAEFGDASELKVGEEVFAIGNPGGDRYGGTLTGGYVSGLNRELEKSAANGLTYIQTDAAINPGNSGGALFNAYGQVVGINSNKVVSTSYEGIGFAIPISEVSNIIGDLMTKGYVSGRGRLGITARTVTELQAEASGIPTGVLIVSVDDDSPLKGIAFAGDIITEAAGEKISSLEDLYAVLRTHGGGESITVTIYSAGTADTKSSEEQYTIVLLEDRGETQAG